MLLTEEDKDEWLEDSKLSEGKGPVSKGGSKMNSKKGSAYALPATEGVIDASGSMDMQSPLSREPMDQGSKYMSSAEIRRAASSKLSHDPSAIEREPMDKSSK
jgi:hypothetical protein